MYELSKREKKIAREAIEKGVLSEFKIALDEAETIIKEWRDGNTDSRQAYHKLYKAIQDNYKHIARRYDGMTGSNYLITVAAILFDGHITEDDIKDFSDDAKQDIKRWHYMWGK